MPSRPQDTGWEFSQALDLIDLDSQDVGPTTLFRTDIAVSSPNNNHIDVKPGIKRLGSFSKLWAQLGVPSNLPLISPELESEDQADSDNALLPPTARVAKQEENVLDEYAGLNKKQRSKARKRAEEERRADAKLEAQHQQKERKEVQREALEFKPVATVNKEVKRKQSAQSNVGAKLRPSSPSYINQPTPIQGKAPTLPIASMIPSKPASRPLLPPTQYTVLDSVNSTLPKRPSSTTVHGATPMPRPTAVSTPKVQHATFSSPIRQQANQFPFPQTGLVPRTVQPVIIPRITQPPVTPQAQSQPQIRQTPVTPYRRVQTPMTPGMTPGMQPRSLTIRGRVDRHFQLFNQLLRDFPEDMPYMLAPMQLCNNEKSTNEGIHVFVDSSNIMIGFKGALHYNRAQGYEMSFDSLVLLMERRRPVAKRVYAGSHRESAPQPHVTKLVQTSKAIGYENIVNEQVLVSREDSEKKKFFRSVKKLGWIKATQLHSSNDGSGSGSGSDPEMEAAPVTPSAPKWVEQGVDEILHLKMCQSIIDVEVPQTIVLATGDGAAAEHSDGFLAHVERALKKGWKVELVCWKQQINGGYKNKKFREKWGEQFKIFYLDGYIELLIDTE
jgi:hypothetical protein